MTGIDSYSPTPATNATATGGSVNWAEGQAPSTVNNSQRQVMADMRSLENDRPWFQYGSGDQGAANLAVPAIYASATTFTIANVDVRTAFHVGRIVRAVGVSTGTIYGRIVASAFSVNTTVTVKWFSGSLINETLTVSISQLGATGFPYPFSVLEAWSFGVKADNATDDTSAAQAAINAVANLGGGVLQLPPGTLLLSSALTVPSNVYIEGVGIGASALTQNTNNLPIFDLSNNSYCGLRHLTLNGGPASAAQGVVVSNAATATVQQQLFENIDIPALGNLAIGFDIQSNPTYVNYWPIFRNINIHGGAGSYQTKVGMRFGTQGGGNNKVLTPKIYGGRIQTCTYGIIFANVDSGQIYGYEMDDIQGSIGWGIYFNAATNCVARGMRFEANTLTQYVVFGSNSVACRVETDSELEPTSAQYTDNGTRNTFLMGNGSGGVKSYWGPNLNFNGNVNILGTGTHQVNKNQWTSTAVGTVSASGNSGALAALSPVANSNASCEWVFQGREVTTNALWEMRGRLIANWDNAGGRLVYGVNTDSQNASVGANDWRSYSIGTVTASEASGVIKLTLANGGTHDLNNVSLHVRVLSTP